MSVKYLIHILLFIGAVLFFFSLLRLLWNPVRRDRTLVKGSKFFHVVVGLILSFMMICSAATFFSHVESSNLVNPSGFSSDAPSRYWGIYYHFIDPGNQHMAETTLGRLIAGIAAVAGILLFNGLLVSSLITAIDRRKERWLKGEIRYHKLRDHILIIGSHDMAIEICQMLLREGEKGYIVIHARGDVEALRTRLSSAIPPVEEERLILYGGDRTLKQEILSLHPERARKIYLLGEEEALDGKEHDSYNMAAMRHIIDTIPASDHPTPLYVLFEYQTAFSVYQFSDIATEDRRKVEFRPFNYYAMWAQRIFAHSDPTALYGPAKHCGEEYSYLPLDTIRTSEGVRFITPDDPHSVHLVVLGMSQMGIALALEAAHVAHYPNTATGKAPRTRITLIDPEAQREMGYLKSRYRHLFALSNHRFHDGLEGKRWQEFSPHSEGDSWSHLHSSEEEPFLLDIEWEFIRGDLSTPFVQEYLQKAADRTLHPHTLLTLAICQNESHRSAASALYLPEALYREAEQVLVWQRESGSLIGHIAHDATGEDERSDRYSRVMPFGMLSSTCNLLFEEERSARLINYVYATEDYTLKEATPERITRAWEESTFHFKRGKSGSAARWSNIYNANTLLSKLRNMGWSPEKGCELEEALVEVMAITEHNRWNMEQLLMHYRPLTAEEQSDLLAGKREKNTLKQQMAHADICTFARLKDLDTTQKYDRLLIRALPYILQVLHTASPKA